MKNKLFLGIDLGTTNSVISYLNLNPVLNRIEPKVFDVIRLDEFSDRTRKKTLPSVVYYKRNSNDGYTSYVGDYAKIQLGKRYGHVVKSVKRYMGQNDVPELYDIIKSGTGDYRPEDVSARIITHLLGHVKDIMNFSKMPDDVIITVPASFDPDMCVATINAAKKAGINVNDHDVLLYEPKAVLYDFVNQKLRNEIPQDLIDLSETKTIMIYDIGGGTIDVSIHKVQHEPLAELISIEDIAISRYTNTAGDAFDAAIAKDMKDEFYKSLRGKDYTISHLEKAVMQKTLQQAENVKIELNERIQHARLNNDDIPDDIAAEVIVSNFMGGYPYDDRITKRRFESIVEPLMGWNLSLDDVNRIDDLTEEEDIENIVYPILDTLSKAKEQDPDLSVDAILLNGGMSKLYLVQERLNQLLGEDIIKITDPDLSVARGAAICHYNYHKYNNLLKNISGNMGYGYQIADSNTEIINAGIITKNTETKQPETTKESIPSKQKNHESFSSILNDTINLAVREGHVYPVVKAGTKLPYESPVFKERFLLSDRTNTIQLPFYLGRGRTTQLPNRRIAWRKAQFKKVYPVGTDVSIKISINSERVMKVEAWITKNKSDHVVLDVDTTKEDPTQKKNGKKLMLIEPTRVNAKEVINNIDNDCKEIMAKKKSFGRGQAKKLYDRIDLTIDSIRNCLNKEDFGPVINDCLGRVSQDSLFRSKLYEISGYIAKHWSEEAYDLFVKYAIYTISPNSFAYMNNPVTITSAIKALGKLREVKALEVLEECYQHSRYTSYRGDIRRALEKIKKAKETVDTRN